MTRRTKPNCLSSEVAMFRVYIAECERKGCACDQEKAVQLPHWPKPCPVDLIIRKDDWIGVVQGKVKLCREVIEQALEFRPAHRCTPPRPGFADMVTILCGHPGHMPKPEHKDLVSLARVSGIGIVYCTKDGRLQRPKGFRAVHNPRCDRGPLIDAINSTVNSEQQPAGSPSPRGLGHQLRSDALAWLRELLATEAGRWWPITEVRRCAPGANGMSQAEYNALRNDGHKKRLSGIDTRVIDGVLNLRVPAPAEVSACP